MKLNYSNIRCVVLLALTTIWFQAVNGQNIDYDRIILPRNSGDNIGIEEKLVQLAWRNHPENRILEKDIELSDLNTKLQKRRISNNITLTSNVNEFIINPSSDTRGFADFYPKYNIQLTLPLSVFFVNPIQSKVEDLKRTQSVHRVNAQKLTVRELVLKTYNNLKMYESIYRIDVAALKDAESSNRLIEEKFETGDESYDVYMSSLKNLNNMRQSEIRSKNNYSNTKIELEAIIGVRFEDVL